MVTKQAKEIIEKAINSPEFIKRLAKGFDFLPCIKKIVECDDGIPLESLKEIVDDKLVELNIRAWFEWIN